MSETSNQLISHQVPAHHSHRSRAFLHLDSQASCFLISPHRTPDGGSSILPFNRIQYLDSNLNRHIKTILCNLDEKLVEQIVTLYIYFLHYFILFYTLISHNHQQHYHNFTLNDKYLSVNYFCNFILLHLSQEKLVCINKYLCSFSARDLMICKYACFLCSFPLSFPSGSWITSIFYLKGKNKYTLFSNCFHLSG